MLKAVLTAISDAVAAKNGLGGRVLGSNQVEFSAATPVNITKVNHKISKYVYQLLSFSHSLPSVYCIVELVVVMMTDYTNGVKHENYNRCLSFSDITHVEQTKLVPFAASEALIK